MPPNLSALVRAVAYNGNVRCLKCDYMLCGLPDDRCPECETSFDPNDPATWAPDSPGDRRSLAIAASFLGAFVGWSACLAMECVRQITWGTGFVIDREALVSVSAMTILVWWGLLVVPCLRSASALSFLRSNSLRSVTIGAMHGCATLSLLLGLGPFRRIWLDTATQLAAAAAVVGIAVAGTTHAALRPRWTRSASRTPFRSLACYWAAVPACLAIWIFAIEPALRRVSPDWAYQIGSASTREWVLKDAIRRIKVGDPASRLQDLLPSVVSPHSNTDYSVKQIFINTRCYEIEIRDHVIVRIEVD